jgi:hypothetical protein
MIGDFSDEVALEVQLSKGVTMGAPQNNQVECLMATWDKFRSSQGAHDPGNSGLRYLPYSAQSRTFLTS